MFYEKQIAVSRIYTNAHIRPIQCTQPILLFHCYTASYTAFSCTFCMQIWFHRDFFTYRCTISQELTYCQVFSNTCSEHSPHEE